VDVETGNEAIVSMDNPFPIAPVITQVQNPVIHTISAASQSVWIVSISATVCKERQVERSNSSLEHRKDFEYTVMLTVSLKQGISKV
jgi:hypothetical protein